MEKRPYMPRPKSQGPRPPWFNDPTFKGRGAIKCDACGEPLADHEGARLCDKVDLPTGARLTVASPAAANYERKKNGR